METRRSLIKVKLFSFEDLVVNFDIWRYVITKKVNQTLYSNKMQYFRYDLMCIQVYVNKKMTYQHMLLRRIRLLPHIRTVCHPKANFVFATRNGITVQIVLVLIEYLKMLYMSKIQKHLFLNRCHSDTSVQASKQAISN